MSSLPCFLAVAMVMDVVVVVEDENVDLLEVNVTCMEADRVPLRKDLSNASTVDAVITSSRSAGRNLIDLSRHNYLSLILLLRVALLRITRLLFSLFLNLPLLY